VSTLEVVKFALVVDRPNLIRVKVCIVLSVCNGGIFTPRAFPQLVKYPKVLIGLQITLVMLNRSVDAYSFERRFLPTSNNVPSSKVHVISDKSLTLDEPWFEVFLLTRCDLL
jgi:hypothetical protein